MASTMAPISAFSSRALLRRQAVVSVPAHFFATICHVFIAAAALVGCTAATKWKLRSVGGEKLLPADTLGGVAAIAATVNRYG
jgi:hypothetical protein